MPLWLRDPGTTDTGTVSPGMSGHARDTADDGFSKHPIGVNFPISDIPGRAVVSNGPVYRACQGWCTSAGGVVVPGVWGGAGGADYGGCPWYGSGSGFCTVFPTVSHCGTTGTTVSQLLHHWDHCIPTVAVLYPAVSHCSLHCVHCSLHCVPGGGLRVPGGGGLRVPVVPGWGLVLGGSAGLWNRCHCVSWFVH